MIATLRSDIRKLFTIRSTYILMFIAMALIGFISLWAKGHEAQPNDPYLLMGVAKLSASVLALFVTITAILSVTHEYRYNTFIYTLTASNSRSKVLFSKLLVLSAWTIVMTFAVALFAMAMARIGLAIKGGELAPQTFYYIDTIWRCVFSTWAYTIVGIILGFLIRNVVGALAFLFLVPNMVEGLMMLLLKKNAAYLPFSALNRVGSDAPAMPNMVNLSPAQAALVVMAYLGVAFVVTWALFVRRDAN